MYTRSDETRSDIISAIPNEQTMRIRGAANSVLSVNEIPLKLVVFPPVLLYSVTQYDSVCTVMKNLHVILAYLEHPVLPVTCDEGDSTDTTRNIVLRLYMAKIALGCLGKYLTVVVQRVY